MFDAEDRFWKQYQIDSEATAFGARWAAFMRAAVFPTLAARSRGAATIAGPRCSAKTRDRRRGRLAAAPEQMQIPLAHLVLIKQRRTK